MPPLPNTLYTRDTTCWIYGGLTLNPLFWPARHDETLLMKAIYEFHPDYVGSTVWWGDPEKSWGLATIEGGDVLMPGNGVVLIGMSERTSRQAITQVAAELFAAGRRREGDRRRDAEAAGGHAPGHGVHLRRPRRRHASTPRSSTASQTFTLVPSDNDTGVEVIEETKPFVEVVAAALELPQAAGGRDRWQQVRLRASAVGQRQQPRRGRTRSGVRLRPQHPHQLAAAQGRGRGHHHRRRRTGPRSRRRALHDLPDHPRPVATDRH